jgi:hypothetical protein
MAESTPQNGQKNPHPVPFAIGIRLASTATPKSSRWPDKVGQAMTARTLSQAVAISGSTLTPIPIQPWKYLPTDSRDQTVRPERYEFQTAVGLGWVRYRVLRDNNPDLVETDTLI